MNIQQPMPVNFRFITEKTKAPVFCKKITSVFYSDNDLKIGSFYKPILFIA
jgi:hypothetical protein